MKSNDSEKAATETAAERAAAADALPRLIAHRDKLEREGGSVSRVERNHWARIAVGAALTLVAVVYALGASGDDGSTPVLPWVVAGACAVATAFLAVLWDKEKSSRKRDHDELSEKMKQVGRRIDNAQRRLRR